MNSAIAAAHLTAIAVSLASVPLFVVIGRQLRGNQAKLKRIDKEMRDRGE